MNALKFRMLAVALLLFVGPQLYAQEGLTDELKDYFKKSVLNKVKRLEHYITLIANKSMDDNLRNEFNQPGR
jgi:hypothetical protein